MVGRSRGWIHRSRVESTGTRRESTETSHRRERRPGENCTKLTCGFDRVVRYSGGSSKIPKLEINIEQGIRAKALMRGDRQLRQDKEIGG